MLARLRRRATFANVTSALALFVALGGTSYAAITLPADSVGSDQIRTGAWARPRSAGTASARRRSTSAPCARRRSPPMRSPAPRSASNSVGNVDMKKDAVTSANVKDGSPRGRRPLRRRASHAGQQCRCSAPRSTPPAPPSPATPRARAAPRRRLHRRLRQGRQRLLLLGHARRGQERHRHRRADGRQHHRRARRRGDQRRRAHLRRRAARRPTSPSTSASAADPASHHTFALQNAEQRERKWGPLDGNRPRSRARHGLFVSARAEAPRGVMARLGRR